MQRVAGFIYDLGGKFALGFVGAFVGVVVTGGVVALLIWLPGNEVIAVGLLVLIVAVALVMLAPRTRALLARRPTQGHPSIQQVTAGASLYLLGLLLDVRGRFWMFALVGSTLGVSSRGALDGLPDAQGLR